jgi:hypothetical protein
MIYIDQKGAAFRDFRCGAAGAVRSRALVKRPSDKTLLWQAQAVEIRTPLD